MKGRGTFFSIVHNYKNDLPDTNNSCSANLKIPIVVSKQDVIISLDEFLEHHHIFADSSSSVISFQETNS